VRRKVGALSLLRQPTQPSLEGAKAPRTTTLSLMTFTLTTFGITTMSVMTLSIRIKHVQNFTVQPSVVMLNVVAPYGGQVKSMRPTLVLTYFVSGWIPLARWESIQTSVGNNKSL